mgnify:FL=1
MRRALFFLLFVSYAYFYQGGGWGQNSRFNLVRAMTIDRSFQIDPYHQSTGDKAFSNGHYYSDKAPGQAFMALLIVEPARRAILLAGGDAETFEGLALLSYLATLLTVSLTTAVAGVVLFDLARTWGATSGGALFAATAFGLATPIWPLATIFIGHALSAACLVLAFAAAWAIGEPHEGSGYDCAHHRARLTLLRPVVHREVALGLTVGLAAGWATVSEFPAAVPAVVLALWTISHAATHGLRRAARIVGAMTAGALLCAVVLMTYQYICFGSPFHLAYSSEQGFDGMQQGLFGVTWPRLSTTRAILLSEYRGLLPLAPLLVAAPFGLARMRHAGGAALIAGVIVFYYVTLNASYHYWEGGWSFGPRHLSPALPFLCLGLAPLWDRARQVGRAALLLLWIWGVAMSLLAVTVMAQPPASFTRPVRELLWPAFRDGDLALSTQTFVHHGSDPGRWRLHQEPRAAWNLGMKLGLTGHASLVPLFLTWTACAFWLRVAHRRPHLRVRT